MEKKKPDYEPPSVKDLNPPEGELSPEDMEKVSGGSEADCFSGLSATATCGVGSGAFFKQPG